MQRRNSTTWAAAAVMPLLITSAATAADIKIEPRLATGVSYYNLDLDGEVLVGTDRIDDVEFNDWLFFVGGGTTVAFDRFFVDIYGQYSFSGRDDLALDVEAGGIAVDDVAQTVDFDRFETTIAAGYRITDRFAAYVGYRYADVDFEGSGSTAGIGVNFDADLKQHGPLIGVGYAVPQTVLGGTLVLNAAVTLLDGDLEAQIDAPAPLADVAFDIDGDAIGLNGGVGWTVPLDGGLRLVLGGDISSYDFEDDGEATDFSELIARLRAELRYSFDTLTY